MTAEYIVAASEAGQRIDVFLVSKAGELSRSGIQRLIAEGAVTLDGEAVDKKRRVAEGECYTLELPEPEPAEALAQDIPLDIVYEDGDIIVINKPRGLVVHPAAGHPDGTLVNALLYHCGESLSGINGVLRPGIVHRIDMDTSGLIVAAKNDAAHQSLTAQLADHSMYREYLALCIGTPKPEAGTVNAPIGRHPRDRKRMAVTERNSREAVTHYEVIERFQGYSLVKCRLETGRTHQIRVHLAYIGHPVAGDRVYGPDRDPLRLGAQCLHALRISLTHPRTSERLVFETLLPDYFQKALDKLRRQES